MKYTFAPESKPLDGFTIKRAIHRGGFGEVYYALSDSGKEVALKLLQQNLEIEIRGVRQCMNLKHPNLVSIFDIRSDSDGDHWIVMEYIHGKTLDHVIHEANGPLPMEDVQSWLAGMAEGLNFLHDRGIVHRDLKPANVFMENGVVKIGDVGLAKCITQSRRSAQTESVGTVYYMAPEVARGRYGHEVDVYSLGVVLYEIITGRLPFDGESTAEILMKHLSDKPDLTPLPKRLRPVIANALEKDPLRRTPNAMRLLEEFQAAVQGVEIATTIPEASFDPAPAAAAPVFNEAVPPVTQILEPSRKPEAGNLDRNAARRERIEARRNARHARREEIRQQERSRRLQRKEARVQRRAKRQGQPVDVAVTVVPIAVPIAGHRGATATADGKSKKTADEKSEQISHALKVGAIVVIALALIAPRVFGFVIWSVFKLALIGGIGYLAYRFFSKDESDFDDSKKTPEPLPVAVPVVKRRAPKLRRAYVDNLNPETPRSIPLRHRATELTGSLVSAVFFTAFITAAIALFGNILSGPSAIAMFGVTALAGSWLVLLSAKLFEGTSVKSGNRRLMHLVAGAVTGCIAFALQQLLFVTFSTSDFNVSPSGLVHTIGTVKLAAGLQPTLAGYIVFFAGLFFLRHWWRHADSLRGRRLSVVSVFLTTFAAAACSLIITFPIVWGVTWAVVISSVVQLSAVWLSADDRRKLVEAANHG